MYARLINGALKTAPKKIVAEKSIVYNPTAEQYFSVGYKIVRFTDSPEAPDGYYYIPGWEEQDDAIVQTWHLEELPPEEMSADEALSIILGGTT